MSPHFRATVVVLCLVVVSFTVVIFAPRYSATLHLFYIPIVLAAFMFGPGAGTSTGLAAAVLAGPFADWLTNGAVVQSWQNATLRGVFFIWMGFLIAQLSRIQRTLVKDGLSEHLRSELSVLTAAANSVPDPVWQRRVQQMLDDGDFETVFQPIYALQTGEMVAVEALTRFHTDPAFPPSEWFEHAGRSSLGIELELATLHAALSAADRFPAHVVVSCNASPSLAKDPRLEELLLAPRGRTLQLELTEHVAIDDYPTLLRHLDRFRAAGVLLAVDDAGAGFASLQHIVQLRPDVIKLDISLSQNLTSDPIRGPLAEAILHFAHATGSRIVAEGLEDRDDLDIWVALGAYGAQGYLLGRPGAGPFPERTDALEQTVEPEPVEPEPVDVPIKRLGAA